MLLSLAAVAEYCRQVTKTIEMDIHSSRGWEVADQGTSMVRTGEGLLPGLQTHVVEGKSSSLLCLLL